MKKHFISQELEALSAVWDNLQEHFKIGAWSIDVLTGEPFITRQVKRIYGAPENQEIPIEKGITFYHEEDRPLLLAALDKAMKQGEPYDLKLRIFREDNQEMSWVRTTARPERDSSGKVVKIYGTIQDITQDRLKDAEWRDNLERMMLALEVSNIGIFDWDIQRNILVWDAQMYAIYEVKRKDFNNAYEVWKACLHPDDREKANRMIEQSVKFGHNLEGRFRIVTQNMNVKWIKVRGNVFYNEDGQPARILGCNMDITQVVKSEEEIEVQKRINMHQAKLASLGEIAAGVGHEVNNPLGIISSNLQLIGNLIEKNPEGGLDVEDLKERIKSLKSACARIAGIVNGLRTFARADSDNFGKVDLVKIIDESIKLYKEIFARAGVEISSDLPSTSMYVDGIAGRLSQVFTNLISNARDALESLPIDRKIFIKLEDTGDGNYAITVRDNGPGVPREIQDRVFENFFTTKAVGKGTGMGLALSNQIVSEHDGWITMQSEPGNGAEFIVTLPKASSIGMQDLADEKLDDSDLNLKILVVDDERDLRKVVAEQLTELGCSVTQAEGGRQAIEILSGEDFDVALIDLKMPDMDGISLGRLIVANFPYPPAIIFQTGADTDEQQNRFIEETPAILGVLHKPFDIEAVQALLLKAQNQNAA